MFSPDSKETEIVSWVNSEFDKARNARLPFERQWFTNMAFFFGRHWVTWGQSGSYQFARMIEPPAPAWRVRLTINKVRSFTNREIARFNSQKPRSFIMPASSEAGDQAIAKVGESIWEFIAESDSVDLDTQQLITDLWVCFTGNGFMKLSYSNEYDYQMEMEGKLNLEAISPFHIFVPYMDQSQIKRQPWVMHTAIKDPDWIKTVFGLTLKPETEESANQLEDRMLNAMQIQEKKSTTAGVLVKEVWVQPTSDFPRGALVRVAQDRVLVEEGGEPWIPWPYEHMRLPIVHRIHTLTNRFYGSTFIEDLISLQRQYNRARSQVIESINKMSRPNWVAVRGSVDTKTITTEPGTIIQHLAGSPPPTQVVPAPLPNQVFESIQATAEEMNEVASQHEVSQGTVPPNVEAATAISYLQERDDAPLFAGIRSKERSYQELGQQSLSLVGQFWDAERTIRVVGKNQAYEAFTFKGSDLKGNTDFRVVPGSGVPQSRAARKAELLELVKMGLVPPQKALAYLDMPELGKLYDELQVDIKQAQRENLKMSTGTEAHVDLNHDHRIHIDEHDIFTKLQEYEALDPQLQQLFRIHTYNHLKIFCQFFGAMPMFPETQDPEFLMQNGGIDPAFEAELRRLYTMIITSGGMPMNPAPPPGAPQGGGQPSSNGSQSVGSKT